MAERVNLPADSGFVVELVLQESVTESGVFNHAHIVCAGLVVHRPATIDELQLSAFDECSDCRFRASRLLRPPTVKKRLLDIGKFAVGVHLALLHHGVDDVLHPCSTTKGQTVTFLVNRDVSAVHVRAPCGSGVNIKDHA